MRRLVVLFCMVLLYSAVYATERPKLIVGITISQFYPEWIKNYEYELGSGGFNRLLKHSKELRADYNYFYTQSGTDQATIYTGTYPAEHGIVSHTWYDRMSKDLVENIDSDTTPVHLKMLTASAYMRMNNQFSKAYSIAMRPEEALMSAGTYANNIFWFDNVNGKIRAAQFFGETPSWLNSLNRRINADSLLIAGWMPLTNELQYKRNSMSRMAAKARADFYYDLGELKSGYQKYQVLNAVPYANDIVTECALELMKRERLGLDKETDLLMLSFSTLDYMNRDYAINSKEFKDLVMRLDRNIERLLTELDERCGPGSYSIFLTVTEGRELLPVDLAQYNMSGNYFSIYRSVALLKSYLKLLYGQGEWITAYNSGQIYLNRELIQKNKLNLADFQSSVAEFMADFEGVSKVITASELQLLSADEGDASLIANSFYSKRSGDVFFTLEHTWVPILQDVEDSYCRYSKRRYVPIYFYGYGADKIEKNACRMIDVLPTICRMAGVTLPYNINGSSLLD